MYNLFVSLVPNVWLSTTFHSRMSHATAQRMFWFLVCWVSFLYPSTECGLFALYTLNIFLHVSNTRQDSEHLQDFCLSQGLCYQGHCKRQDCHCTQWNHTGMQDIWLSSRYKCLSKTLCPPPFPLLLFSVLLYFLTISSFIHPLSSFPPLPSPPPPTLQPPASHHTQFTCSSSQLSHNLAALCMQMQQFYCSGMDKERTKSRLKRFFSFRQ